MIAEKEEILKRILNEEDPTVIHALKELLDNVSGIHMGNEKLLNQELDEAIKEADEGDLIPYGDIRSKLAEKYNL